MKKFKRSIAAGASLFLLSLILSQYGPIYPESVIRWQKYNTGRKKSERTKKPIMIFFYSEWCIYCKKMDREIFTDSEIIGKINRNFIPIRLDVNKRGKSIRISNKRISPEQLFSMMNGSVLPYLVFLDHKGSLITTIPGFLEKRIFSPLLSYIDGICYNKDVSFEDYLMGSKKCK